MSPAASTRIVLLSSILSSTKQVLTASKKVLGRGWYLTGFLLLTPLIAFLLFLIPIASIPGNDVHIQLRLFGATDYLLLGLLAALESLLVVLFVYWLRTSTLRRNNLSTFGGGNLGMLSGVPAFLFGTKLCPVCIASIFGAFGPGAVVFTAQYRSWIFAASLVILMMSIYSISKKISSSGCKRCASQADLMQP